MSDNDYVCDWSFTLFSSFLSLSAIAVIVNKVVCCREHTTDFSSRRKRHYTFDFKCYKQGIIFYSILHVKVSMCVWVAYDLAFVWRSKDSLDELTLCFYRMSARNYSGSQVWKQAPLSTELSHQPIHIHVYIHTHTHI